MNLSYMIFVNFALKLPCNFENSGIFSKSTMRKPTKRPIYLDTYVPTWGAVKTGEIHQWPALISALKKLKA